jgi:hypothetical protein
MSAINKQSIMTQSIIKYFIEFLESQNINNMENIVRELNSEKTIEGLSELLSDKKVKDKKVKDKKVNDVKVREKKVKDENAPKRPKNAYMFYCEKTRQSLKEENPDMNMIEITKLIGVNWKKLSEEEKNEFQEKASVDKKRYEEENKSYIKPIDDEPSDDKPIDDDLVEKNDKKKGSKKGATKKGAKKKKVDGPKKPMSAYIYFCMEKRKDIKEESPDMSAVEVTRELGRLWREDYSDEESRKKWTSAAEQDKKRYKEESGSEEKEIHKEKEKEKESCCESEAENVDSERDDERDNERDDSDREPKRDEWYYGKIPNKCTYEKLVKIMAKGLIKFRKDYHKNENVKYKKVIKIMDLWFEHDSNMDNKFSDLVKDERYDEFENDVLETIKTLEK